MSLAGDDLFAQQLQANDAGYTSRFVSANRLVCTEPLRVPDGYGPIRNAGLPCCRSSQGWKLGCRGSPSDSR
jgi:hypothetical protein